MKASKACRSARTISGICGPTRIGAPARSWRTRQVIVVVKHTRPHVEATRQHLTGDSGRLMNCAWAGSWGGTLGTADGGPLDSSGWWFRMKGLLCMCLTLTAHRRWARPCRAPRACTLIAAAKSSNRCLFLERVKKSMPLCWVDR